MFCKNTYVLFLTQDDQGYKIIVVKEGDLDSCNPKGIRWRD